MKQLLPVFPELLDEVARSWRDWPFSSRSLLSSTSSLDCDAMESRAGPRNPRPRLQLCRHSLRKLPRPGRRIERPDHPSLHRWCSWKFHVFQLHLFGFWACTQGPPSLPSASCHGPCKSKPWETDIWWHRVQQLPLSHVHKHAHTHTSFRKENRMCPASASRLSADGTVNKSQNYQNKQPGGDTRCPPSVEGCGLPQCSTKRGRYRTEKWASLTAPTWVLRTISRGYRLQFAAVPQRFTGIIHSQAQGESNHVLQEEILSLLNKGAICVIPPAQRQSGFYSRYFLVPKLGGGQYLH